MITGMEQDGPFLKLTRVVARALARTIFRIRVIGEEHVPAGPVLIVGNHTGFLDGPLLVIMLSRPSVVLAKSELFKGVVARILTWARQIPVHRGTPDREALQQAVAVLNSGGVVGIFPEGTRGEGQLETIQDGVGYIAAKYGGPVVPVVCVGTAQALPKGKILPKFRAPIDIVFGEPFYPGAVSTAARDERELTREEIHESATAVAVGLRKLVDEVAG